MSALDQQGELATELRAFVAELLQREGALAESDPSGALECLLPIELQSALELPEAPRLRVLGEAGAEEVALPLESAAMRWCLERASESGRVAAAFLPHVRPRGQGVAEAVRAHCHALNGVLRIQGTRTLELRMWILEWRYEAIGEERAEGCIRFAYEPEIGILSAPLAELLLAELLHAEPAPLELEPARVTRATEILAPRAEAAARAALAPLRARLRERLGREAHRIAAYYGKLARETGRRRGKSQTDEALEAKRAAILRQREEKLKELAFRHALALRIACTSLLELRYPATVCDVFFQRRRLEVPRTFAWEPHLREIAPTLCPACVQPALSFYVCDEAGHASCATCSAPCKACTRTTCRVCHPAGCRTCTR